MKKFLIIFGLVLGFASAVYADGHFCCSGSKEECCAEKGKMYCPSDNTCRTRCLKVTPPECVGGCINPEGVCCAWCPSMEVCEAMGKCQKIVDGCYQCVECPIPNPCPAPQCMNEDGVCCDECPRVCPEGQCLVNLDGCYECGTCDRPLPPVDDDDDEPTECTGACEVYENGACVDKMTTKWTGDCCNEGTVSCCPLTGDCNCYPIKDECECEPPKKVSSEGYCCDKDWVPVTEIECEADGLCYVPNDGCPICEVCDTETTDSSEPDDDDDTETTDSPEPDDDDDTETEDLCIGKPEIDNCMKCDSRTGEYTIPVTCPDCEECKTLEEGGTGQCSAIVCPECEECKTKKKGGTGQCSAIECPECEVCKTLEEGGTGQCSAIECSECEVCKTTDKGCEPIECPDCEECKTLEKGGTGQCEQIVPTAEERAEAEKKLKNSGYIHDEQPDCDYTQESLYMSYREAGYCTEGGKYSACLDRAPVLECGNLVRYDKPSYSNRNSVCEGREAGYKGWHSQGLNGAKSQQLAMLWDGGYISMGQMFYSSMCNLLETDYNNTLSIRTGYCCPYKENVACSASNGISQCCQYAGKLPDDKKIKCYLDNTEIEMSYICCPSESASVVEVMDSDGKGTGSYICCDVGTNATKVEGGNEGEYICCAEGETAWKDSYGKRQCCATDSEVKNMEVDGTVLYQCCKKEETAFLQYNGDVPYLGCCTEGNVQTVDADGKTLNVCCKDGETAYWHGSKSDETTKNLSYVKCCPGEVYQEKETTETNSKLCCGEVGEEGKDVSSATGTYGTYNLCCESGTELKILFETENGDLETKCCTKGVDLHIMEYRYIDDENKNPLYGCCPVDAPKAKEYKEGGLTYHLCCTEDKIAKHDGTKWVCGCPENKDESAYGEDDEFLCCEKGLSAVEQDDGTWKCGCPKNTPNRQTYEKDGVSYSLCCENGLSAVEQDDEWVCACPEDKPKHKTYEKDGKSYHVCCLEREETVRMGSTGAYMCCEKGLIAVEKEGEWICGCADGQIPVDNYIDGGGVSGKKCCEVKEDEESSKNECDDGYCQTSSSYDKGYRVVGAVKGVCCGGYTSYGGESYETVGGDFLSGGKGDGSSSYAVNINGGIPYCAKTHTYTDQDVFGLTTTDKSTYPSVDKYLYTHTTKQEGEDEGGWGISCTATEGNPASGDCEDWYGQH